MAQRCEVCGARWSEDATDCRDCGAPRLAPSASTSVAAAAPVTIPAGISEPVPIGTTQRNKHLMIGAAVAGVAVVALVIGMVSSEPEASADQEQAQQVVGRNAECPEISQLAGEWVFTTVTTGARKKKRLGMKGYYELSVKVDGCEAIAELVKVGRTGAEHYDDAHKHRDSAELRRGEGPYAFGFGAVFDPRNEAGQGIPKRFTFTVDGERLIGTWRQRGAKWRSSGQFGLLEGRRDGDPRELRPRRSSLPCHVECAVPADIDAADAKAEVSGLDDCLASCR